MLCLLAWKFGRTGRRRSLANHEARKGGKFFILPPAASLLEMLSLNPLALMQTLSCKSIDTSCTSPVFIAADGTLARHTSALTG